MPHDRANPSLPGPTSARQHPTREILLQEVVGYLNFSSGTPDSKFLANLNQLWVQAEIDDPDGETPAIVSGWLLARIAKLEQAGGAFTDCSQAAAVVRLVDEKFRGIYHEFHRDLLWHRQQYEVWNAFFYGRVAEAVLAQGPPWDEVERIIPAAREQFDDFVGYRPLPVLENEQRVEPYPHEWVRPVPLYIAGAGVAHGPYAAVLSRAIEILRQADPDLLRDAWFDLSHVEEIALDPRAYDFDHPVNKRPNYHFGQWDPNRIDGKGFYRRFVLQPVTLDALVSRISQAAGDRPDGSYHHDELVFEAAAVLAGTMLMASGTSGNGPGCHNSEVTLSTLLPQIAEYRDRFYTDLLAHAEGPHGKRLRAESQQMRQPFANARQHLNQELAHRRAEQLQQVHLAQLDARMGYPEAAQRRAAVVQVASARMLTQIYCLLSSGHQAIDNRRYEAVAEILPQIDDLLQRGIQCGALVDPWTIVGFGGNYSLFPALENTVHDYRVDDLIQLVEQVLDLCSRAWTEAAAIDNAELEKVFSKRLAELSTWWDRYASSTVSGVERLVAKEIEVSTNFVAGALNAWHKAGAAAGDIGFWKLFVDQFDTPKAFQLVIEALLDRGDFEASMALLIQWVGQAAWTPLEAGDASFALLAERWLRSLEAKQRAGGGDVFPRVMAFLERLEANAEEFWHAPRFEAGSLPFDNDEDFDDELDGEFDEDSDDEDDNPFDTEESEFEGYSPEDDDEDEFVDEFADSFEDSTNDGMESAVYDPDAMTNQELEYESKRLEARLAFLRTVAQLWKRTALVWGGPCSNPVVKAKTANNRERFSAWRSEAGRCCAQLEQLLDAVQEYEVATPSGDHAAMMEYDRQRMLRDGILESTISAYVDMVAAQRLLAAASEEAAPPREAKRDSPFDDALSGVLSCALAGFADGVQKQWPAFVRELAKRELLYIPLVKGGDPRKIATARSLHQLFGDLLTWLPRLGLVRQACELLDLAQQMEIERPVGNGAVTEYDRLFESGYQAIVQCLVASSSTWDHAPPDDDPHADARPSDELLVQALQDLTESQLGRWLQHSRTVRLSVVEKLSGKAEWERFVHFVQKYGHDLFTQKFLALGNLRAILHQRVGVWLSTLVEEEGEDSELRLVQELAAGGPREEAVEMLSVAIEAVVENYREYRDYNSTTSQSDRGELLYTLIDFLRVRNNYDRVAWNLKPVFLAHKILVRQNRPAAAELWRQAVAERTSEAADAHLLRLNEIVQRYGMRLPTIAERLAERFVRPLVIDRLRALAPQVMQAAHNGAGELNPHFEVLEDEVDTLMSQPSGAGLDIPDWISAIEEEVTAVRQLWRHQQPAEESSGWGEQVLLSWDSLQQQLQDEGQR